MIQALCVLKFRDKNNNICGYRITDQQGNTKDVTSDQLKQAIKSKQISIINLKLTSDNRLVESIPTQIQQKSQKPQIIDCEQKIKNSIMIATLLGFTVKVIEASHGGDCYLISESETQHSIYIPDNVEILNQGQYAPTFTRNIVDLKGNLKVIGGNNICCTEFMFSGCEAQSIDLSSFNTSNVWNMKGMFEECKAQYINLSGLNTSSVHSMKRMFYKCEVKSLDLSSFDTSKVTDMGNMFRECQAESIDLSTFNTSKVTSMVNMFYGCQVKSLDLSSFDTSKVKDMRGMFLGCKVKSIDLSSFDTSKVEDMNYMFKLCQAKSIDLSSFNTSKVVEKKNIFKMFHQCEAKIKATDQKMLDQYEKDQRLEDIEYRYMG